MHKQTTHHQIRRRNLPKRSPGRSARQKKVRLSFPSQRKKQSKTDIFAVGGETGCLNIRQERELTADNPGKLFARELNTEEAIVESFSAQVGSFDQREQEEESGFYTLGWDEVYDMRVDTRDIYLICENK
jgi:phage repressor protein C with HTH and peptisase S24 domain